MRTVTILGRLRAGLGGCHKCGRAYPQIHRNVTWPLPHKAEEPLVERQRAIHS